MIAQKEKTRKGAASRNLGQRFKELFLQLPAFREEDSYPEEAPRSLEDIKALLAASVSWHE